MRRTQPIIVVAFALTLIGCNKEDPAQLAADGKATGAACRHAGRAIEDCFAQNPDALRGAVFDGWKEMNDYMRENKIVEVKPAHQPEAEDDAHADAGHAEGGEQHAESGEGEHADAGTGKTKVAAAEHGAGAHAEKRVVEKPANEGGGKHTSASEGADAGAEKH